MAVRYDHEIQLGEVNPFCLGVALKNVRVVSGIKQNSLAAIFDKSGIAPVFLHCRIFAKSIVKHRNLGLLGNGGCTRRRRIYAVGSQNQECDKKRKDSRLDGHFHPPEISLERVYTWRRPNSKFQRDRALLGFRITGNSSTMGSSKSRRPNRKLSH